MRSTNIILATLIILSIWVQAQGIRAQTTQQHKRLVIAASIVLDGKGHVLHDTRIVIEGSKIVAIDPKAGPVDYDLRGMTVLPAGLTRMYTSPGASARMEKMRARERPRRMRRIELPRMRGSR